MIRASTQAKGQATNRAPSGAVHQDAPPPHSTGPAGWLRNAAYGLLGAPLAMAALPLFVQLPPYYASHFGVALTELGWVLFCARLIDMLQDPLLGHLLDHAGQRQGHAMLLAAALLSLAFAGLWLPPLDLTAAARWLAPLGIATVTAVAALWLGTLLVLAYGAHSLLQIGYLAWGARLPGGGLAPVAWREGAGLAGVIVASLIPPWILAGPAPQLASRLGSYSTAFALLLAAATGALLLAAPRAPASAPSARPQRWRSSLRALSANPALRALLPAYLLNALSVAIPATLAMFFISDRLQAAPLAGAFLASYFVAAACGLPAWTALARRWGALRSWRLGMLLAVAGFASAGLLGPGDIAPYFAVCLAAGAALGADLALPPVLLASALGSGQPAGAAFGIFTLLGKLALALSGLSLPLIAMLDYQPGAAAGSGHAALTAIYAGLPCLLKLLALAALPRQTPAPTSATLGSLT